MSATSSPAVSVLAVTYNHSDLLNRAILSVLDQTFEDWEMCLIDDGSKDYRTQQVLYCYEELADPRITICRHDTTPEERRATCRYATLFNEAFSLTSGKYVSYLSGDDYWLRDRLEHMVPMLDEGADVVYGQQVQLHPSGAFWGVREAEEVLDDAWWKVDAGCVMQTRKSYQDVDGWPETSDTKTWAQADAYFWRKLTDKGYRFVPVDHVTDAKQVLFTSIGVRMQNGLTPWY